MSRTNPILQRERKKERKNPQATLKDKVNQIKINNMVNNFARKISMNSAYREPVDFTPFKEQIDTSDEINGI